MFAIEPSSGCACYEELTSVSIRSLVSHAYETCSAVAKSETLVVEVLSAVNCKTTCSVTIKVVATLDHKVLAYSVEERVLIALRVATQSVFTSAELPEIFGCPRHFVSEELNFNATCRLLRDRYV